MQVLLEDEADNRNCSSTPKGKPAGFLRPLLDLRHALFPLRRYYSAFTVPLHVTSGKTEATTFSNSPAHNSTTLFDSSVHSKPARLPMSFGPLFKGEAP